MERGRFDDALREFDEDIRIDPGARAFHRFEGSSCRRCHGRDEAADAFRAAWLLDPADPQNAYRLIVAYRSAQTTPQEIERALETLTSVERELIQRERATCRAPFINVTRHHRRRGRRDGVRACRLRARLLADPAGELDSGACRAARRGRRRSADHRFRRRRSEADGAGHRRAAAGAGSRRPSNSSRRPSRAASDSSEAHRMLGTAYLMQWRHHQEPSAPARGRAPESARRAVMARAGAHPRRVRATVAEAEDALRTAVDRIAGSRRTALAAVDDAGETAACRSGRPDADRR